MITTKIIHVLCSPLIPLWHNGMKESQTDFDVSLFYKSY